MAGHPQAADALRRAIAVMTSYVGDGTKPLDVDHSTDVVASYINGPDPRRETLALINGLVHLNANLLSARRQEVGVEMIDTLQEFARMANRVELDGGDAFGEGGIWTE